MLENRESVGTSEWRGGDIWRETDKGVERIWQRGECFFHVRGVGIQDILCPAPEEVNDGRSYSYFCSFTLALLVET